VIHSPHDPDPQWSAKGRGKEKKSWMGYKVQVAESLPEESALNQERFITCEIKRPAAWIDQPNSTGRLVLI
jgi:hypothetical protein